MKITVRKILAWFLRISVATYLLLCILLYLFQEKAMFPDTKLAHDYKYHFKDRFEERNIHTHDGKTLSGVLFKSDSSKGVIFYLHGLGHSLNIWGKYAHSYTSLHYDIFFVDYRGYGKSEGTVSGEKQLYGDMQAAYDNLKTSYQEKSIVILGYSFGTAPAAMLAAANHPKLLLLQAPYYQWQDFLQSQYPYLFKIFPSFLLKYKLKTFSFVSETKAPIVIFHGNADKAIHVEASLRLSLLLKPTDELIILDKQGHDGFTGNLHYLKELKRILAKQ